MAGRLGVQPNSSASQIKRLFATRESHPYGIYFARFSLYNRANALPPAPYSQGGREIIAAAGWDYANFCGTAHGFAREQLQRSIPSHSHQPPRSA